LAVWRAKTLDNTQNRENVGTLQPKWGVHQVGAGTETRWTGRSITDAEPTERSDFAIRSVQIS
jgi:hypothetical protein